MFIKFTNCNIGKWTRSWLGKSTEPDMTGSTQKFKVYQHELKGTIQKWLERSGGSGIHVITNFSQGKLCGRSMLELGYSTLAKTLTDLNPTGCAVSKLPRCHRPIMWCWGALRWNVELRGHKTVAWGHQECSAFRYYWWGCFYLWNAWER